MSIHGKLDVIHSLDSLLYCHFVYTYFLDASLLVLIFRIFLQLPLLSPLLTSRANRRTLRTATGVATAELGICILIHATTEPGQPGILIDFVGNRKRTSAICIDEKLTVQDEPDTVEYHSSSLRVIMLDLIIYVLQVIRIFIMSTLHVPDNGTVTTLPVPAPLISALGAESLTLMLPSAIPTSSDEEGDPFYRNELVVDVGLRASLNSVLQSPPREEDPIDRLPV
ncbi:hypothetical protein BJV82DRAFT_628482 [Fennellomyces sp. T-0311]|nr:hypothetical protein BJV82DRAFT_628482 [Fennellomyces sp. T-0311]